MSDTSMTTPVVPAWRWWEARRLRYNIGLALAGWAAWALFAIEAVAFMPTFRIAPSITIGQGLVWLVAMGIANVLYMLGPITETLLKPADAEAYRRRMFGLGFAFSIAVPFLFPAVVLVSILASHGL